MPGTPPTSPRFGVPRYANEDEVDFAGQVNAITDIFDEKVHARIETVSSLPAGAPVGTEVYYSFTNGGRTRIWHLQRSFAGWTPVGAQVPLFAQDSGSRSQTVVGTSAWTDFGVSSGDLTIPTPGTYDIEIGATEAEISAPFGSSTLAVRVAAGIVVAGVGLSARGSMMSLSAEKGINEATADFEYRRWGFPVSGRTGSSFFDTSSPVRVIARNNVSGGNGTNIRLGGRWIVLHPLSLSAT